MSYLKRQLRQNWVASIKARKDKHSSAGVSLTSELEYVKFDGSHRLFPTGFRKALCPAEAWFTGYVQGILSSSHFARLFFSLMHDNWILWMFVEVDFFFFFFCSVLVQRMPNVPIRVPAKFHHLCSEITWFPAMNESWNHNWIHTSKKYQCKKHISTSFR